MPLDAGSTVSSLVEKHHGLIAQASPPPRSSPLAPPAAASPSSPSPSPSPARDVTPLPLPTPSHPQVLKPALDSASQSSSTPPPSMSGSATLGDIQEGEAVATPTETAPVDDDDESELEGDENLTESVLFPAKKEEGEVEKEEGEIVEDPTAEPAPAPASEAPKTLAEVAAAAASLPTPTPSATPPKSADPIARILEALPALSITEQDNVRRNLERLGAYPPELPLSASWTLFFSDTASTVKGAHHGAGAATQEQYTESHRLIFTCTSVPGLCGALKALKRLARSKRAKALEPDSMGISSFRPGQNLHFFRTGVSPTWEDPWNERGGRLTISPPNGLIDLVYERLVLLLAGSSLESATSDLLAEIPGRDPAAPEGLIIGVVASRRARGDRIELWLGGKKKGENTPVDFINCLKDVLSGELEMPEIRTGKYKKHF